jgi:hypothetical protein
MATARYHHTATLLANGTVLGVGGYGGPGLVPASAEIFDPATGRFYPTGSLATARGGHTTTRRDDGTVLVNGTKVEIYDPATGTWHIARNGHTAPR